MSGTAEDEHPEAVTRSVFGRVDQDSVISRLDQAPQDEAETSFFERALKERDAAADRVFEDGVLVMGGRTQPSRPGLAAPVPSGPGEFSGPVEYAGTVADDVRARRSFILHGPAGVRRQP